MDVNLIQRNIIGAVVSENQFAKVAWLIPKDFNHPYSELWAKILEAPEDAMRLAYSNSIAVQCSHVVSYTFIDRLGLMLLEVRFRQYVEAILKDMLSSCSDVGISLIIQKSIDQSVNVKIFTLVESLPEYLGNFTDAKRLHDLKTYIDGRCAKIKELTK